MADLTHAAREERAERLKERIYVSFAALAVVLTLSGHDESDAGAALRTLLVTVFGTLLAIFTADIVSHLVVHEQAPTRAEFRRMLATSFGAVGAVGVPIVFLLVALTGVWTTSGALYASAIALIAALVVFGWVAARKVPLRWWQRLIVLGAEAVLGLAVVGLQLLAHGG